MEYTFTSVAHGTLTTTPSSFGAAFGFTDEEVQIIIKKGSDVWTAEVVK